MAIRGTTFAGVVEGLAAIVVFVLLTLLPWQLVVALLCVFLNVHLKGERHRERVARLERNAETQRELIRADRDRAEALRCRGGALR